MRKLIAVLGVGLMLLVLAAWASPPRPDPEVPEGTPRDLGCELRDTIASTPLGPDWCPNFSQIYDCEDRVVVISQGVAQDDLFSCVMVRISRLKVERWSS